MGDLYDWLVTFTYFMGDVLWLPAVFGMLFEAMNHDFEARYGQSKAFVLNVCCPSPHMIMMMLGCSLKTVKSYEWNVLVVHYLCKMCLCSLGHLLRL